MAMVANNPKFAKKVHIPSKVGKHFMQADKGKRFAEGKEVKAKPSDKNFTPEQQRQAANKNELLNRPPKPPKAEPVDNDLKFQPDPTVTHPQDFKKGGLMKESKAMAQAEMKALKRGHAPKKVMEHEKKEHKEMGYKKGGHVKHAPKHHAKHMRRGGMSARMAAPRRAAMDPAALAAAMPAAGAGPIAAGPGAMPGMAHGGHIHHHAKGGHVHHHHHYAKGGHVKHHAKHHAKGGGINTPFGKGVEKVIGGKSHKGHHGDEAAKKGHTKGKVVKMASGGHVGSHKHRKADGIAMKGHTKGRVC